MFQRDILGNVLLVFASLVSPECEYAHGARKNVSLAPTSPGAALSTTHQHWTENIELNMN